MTDDEFESRDEWETVVREAQGSLKQRGIATTISEVGLMDKAVNLSWELFADYELIVPVYTLKFVALEHAELSIVSICIDRHVSNPSMYPNRTKIPPPLLEPGEPRVFAVARIGVEPGHVVIAPRDLESEVNEWFHHTKVSIEGYEDFRTRHSCRFDSPTDASEVLTSDFLTLVDGLGDIHLEIQGEILIAGYKRKLDLEQLTPLANFIREFGTPVSPK